MSRSLKKSALMRGWMRITIVAAVIIAAALGGWSFREGSQAASTGTTGLLTIQGSGAGTDFGDYVSSSGGLNTAYHFFIEVPPGLSRLKVEIFDADVGLGGTAEAGAGRDRDRNGFNSSASYKLFNPSGVQQTTQFTTGNSAGPANSDDAWLTLYDATAPPSIEAGHWELRVDMSSAVTGGDDINALGIRANDGTATSGGTELNIYTDSIYPFGVNPPATGTASRSYTMYPYITSGCSCSENDFDYDSNNGDVGSIQFTSRSGNFQQTFGSTALSGNNVWNRGTISGWTSDGTADDYGIWSSTVTIKSYDVSGTLNGNLASLYLGNFQAANNPPTANPVANSFRLYLPTDAGTAPSKPYVTQQIIGPASPPVVGQSVDTIVWLQVINPTANAITFSSTDLVTANVPGGSAHYAGNAQVSQGSIVSQPAVGGTGDITWNPGTVAAGSREILSYLVNVLPTSAGQRIPVTGTPASGNGTLAKFRDETGNNTQARATYLFGPLCELALTQGTLAPLTLPGCGIGPSTLPDGRQHQLYSQQFSLHPIMVTAGSLPPGLSIDSTGTLTGRPTTAGTYNFDVEAANVGLLCASTAHYSLTINPPTAANGVISGRIVSTTGAPVEGAVVNLHGSQERKTITDASGSYRFDNVETSGFYVVTPSRVNYSFSPLTRSFSQLGSNTDAVFTGLPTGDAANPLDTPEYFVRQQYVDVLGREPDETGFNYWSDQILACQGDAACTRARRQGVAAAFFIEQEFQQSGAFIYDLYAGALGRRPTFAEYAADRQQVVGGADLEAAKTAFTQSFVQRAQFMTKYQDAMTAEGFVEALIESAQSAGVDLSGERARLLSAYLSGAHVTESRAAVVQAVAENAAFRQSQYQQAFVLTEYFGYLRRDPDQGGYDFWVRVTNSGAPNIYQGMVCSFITSAEYQRRFSGVVSHGNGECGP